MKRHVLNKKEYLTLLLILCKSLEPHHYFWHIQDIRVTTIITFKINYLYKILFHLWITEIFFVILSLTDLILIRYHNKNNKVFIRTKFALCYKEKVLCFLSLEYTSTQFQYTILMQLINTLDQSSLKYTVNYMLYLISFKHISTLLQYSILMQLINSLIELSWRWFVNNIL